MTSRIFISLSMLFLTSFTSVRKENHLFQAWIYESHNDQTMIFKSQENLSRKAFGIQFEENGVLKVTQNIGWCATPPINYSVVEGRWQMESDSIIVLRYSSKEKNIQKGKIIELTSDKLVLQFVK